MRKRKSRTRRIDLSPASSITVSGPVQRGGTLTVVAADRVVELEVSAGETADQVAERLAAALACGDSGIGL